MRGAITCLFLYFTLPAVAQMIPWSADRALVWDDFKGKKPRKTRFAAVTASRLQFSTGTGSRDSTSITVTALFNPGKSWTRSKKYRPYLLKHEQNHFDITEIYARKIRSAFRKYFLSHTYNSNTEAALWQIYISKRKKWRSYERKYDHRTRHSRRKTQQAEWNTRIADELYELRAFEIK